jgi:hypothetical protein
VRGNLVSLADLSQEKRFSHLRFKNDNSLCISLKVRQASQLMCIASFITAVPKSRLQNSVVVD